MTDRIAVQRATGPTVGDLDLEIVERKGLGHPDTLCDQIMEHVARTLAQSYIQRTGAVRHFNCDKALLAAGQVTQKWGGGSVVAPMRLVIGDRATMTWKNEDLHIGELAIDAARQWIGHHLRYVNPVADVTFEVALKPGSPELTGLYAETATANDTAAAVGYAPMTETEHLVLELERMRTLARSRRSFPKPART